jgi:hypothetical protein
MCLNYASKGLLLVSGSLMAAVNNVVEVDGV